MEISKALILLSAIGPNSKLVTPKYNAFVRQINSCTTSRLRFSCRHANTPNTHGFRVLLLQVLAPQQLLNPRNDVRCMKVGSSSSRVKCLRYLSFDDSRSCVQHTRMQLPLSYLAPEKTSIENKYKAEIHFSTPSRGCHGVFKIHGCHSLAVHILLNLGICYSNIHPWIHVDTAGKLVIFLLISFLLLH